MRLVRPNFTILTAIDSRAILERIEAAGRVCYKSEKQITNDSARQFVKHVIGLGHESVIEHESLSVRFTVDRGVSHELVRHRLCAFSQESTRYCNYKGGVTFVIPPWVEILPGDYLSEGANRFSYPDLQWFAAMQNAESWYRHLLDAKWTPQQARSVLPNSLKTEIVTTANLREWRHILRLRTSTAAHPQMREIMLPLLGRLQHELPIIFDDISAE